VLADSSDGLSIRLDDRPVRTPTNAVLMVPASKPHLASAIALEWDVLTSVAQALKQHHIPLTSLTCRALDIQAEDSAAARTASPTPLRDAIVAMLLRYLETDTLLCWDPPAVADPPGNKTHPSRTESLRAIQARESSAVAGWLTERIWPGITLRPALDETSIMPRSQSKATRHAFAAWARALDAWDLAGLERAALAAKGVLVAARLVAEWSEHGAGSWRTERVQEPGSPWGIDQAERIADLETRYQTARWGEVEDSHDVQREDLRRQLGSVILLVSGNGGAKRAH
jgi:ATP synthase F1 complex assembly factor 2